MRVLLFACALVLPAVAHAESALLLPHRGDDGLAEAREEAHEALREALAGQGMEVIPHADAVASLVDAPGADCASVDCAPALLRAAQLDVAVAVAVWSEGRPPRPASVFVSLVDIDGNRFPATVRVGGAVADAARAALLDARALQLLGPGPWIRIAGEPSGAEVKLDGDVVGVLPYRARIDAGRHVLEVRAEGMRTHAQTVDIPPSASRMVELDVFLERGVSLQPTRSGPVGATDAYEPPPSGRPIVGPLILGGAGLALGGVVLADVLAGDECTRRDNGTCTRRESTNSALAIGLGGAAVAAVTGAILWRVLAGDDD